MKLAKKLLLFVFILSMLYFNPQSLKGIFLQINTTGFNQAQDFLL